MACHEESITSPGRAARHYDPVLGGLVRARRVCGQASTSSPGPKVQSFFFSRLLEYLPSLKRAQTSPHGATG